MLRRASGGEDSDPSYRTKGRVVRPILADGADGEAPSALSVGTIETLAAEALLNVAVIHG